MFLQINSEEGPPKAAMDRGAAGDPPAPAAACPLDLNKEHLPTNSCLFPVETAFPARNWFVKEGYPGPSEDGNFVCKIQTFRPGGYECTVKRLNLPKLAAMANARRRTGKREETEDRSSHVIEKSVRRAKRNLRLSVKNIAADRLFTLTRREAEDTRLEWWSPDDWANAWARFIRLAKKAGIDLAYVAVLEPHKKGNFHLHVAICGFININLARHIWLSICGGKGAGNVDVRTKKGCPDRLAKSSRIAKYISKYISKGFDEQGRFNKKRYWASKHSLPDVKRIIMNSPDIISVIHEFAADQGLSLFRVLDDRFNMFVFPDGGGFWFNFQTAMGEDPPF